MALDNRAIGTLIPEENCGDDWFHHNLQFTLEVPNKQDVWFQTLLEMESNGQMWNERSW